MGRQPFHQPPTHPVHPIPVDVVGVGALVVPVLLLLVVVVAAGVPHQPHQEREVVVAATLMLLPLLLVEDWASASVCGCGWLPSSPLRG